MPFEVMDQRGTSASPHFSEDVRLPAERQIGFWKQNTMPDKSDQMAASSPMELPRSNLSRDQEGKLGIIGRGASSLSESSRASVDGHPKSWSELHMQTAANNANGNMANTSLIQHESSLFSSSLSEIFSRNMRLSRNNVSSHQPSIRVDSHSEEESFESLKEMEAKTIGNLLPDEDDLFSGVTDRLGLDTHANRADELEDFDLFSSGGGLELEGDDRLGVGHKNFDLVGASNGLGGPNGSVVGEHPYGEHPSRTLFVRNINSNVEDSELKALFEQYGDIRTLYTACKQRGFVMISYHDIRAARNAMRALQNKPLRHRSLDIHYSIPKDNDKDANQGTLVVFNLDSSVSTDELQRIFGVFGEIKEIRETPHKQNHKLIEFYDARAAEAALRTLNRSDIAGKQIKLEPSFPGGVRRFVQQSDQDLDDSILGENPFDDLMAASMVSPGVNSSGRIDNGSASLLHNVIRSPANTFMEPNRSSTIPMNLPSSTVASLSNQFILREPNQSLDEVQFANQMTTFHPRSFPDYHDNLAKSLPLNSSNTIQDMVNSLGSRMTDVLDNRHIRGVGANGHLREPNGAVFGSPGNGRSSLNGNHFAWSNAGSHQQHPSSAMIWPNSSSFVNGIHANRLQHVPAFPRAPPVMLNAASPVHHHIGSAPPVNSSFWDRRHAYAGESPDTSGFHMGSFGSVGYPGISSSHPVEIAKHNIFSHAHGSNGVVHSPQQIGHLFPGRNSLMSMPGSFESSSERGRNFSHRRNDSNSNNADKKHYELDIDRIKRGDDIRTTLMIKNIPNKYTSKMLLSAIDEYCRGTYDFVYLPIDFKNKCNVGYAFINIIDPQQIVPFYKAFNGKKWEKFNSEKVASLAYARIQGKTALIAHFQNSSLMNEDKRCRPILFHTEGPNAGDQEPFPMGANIRSRPGRPRTTSPENNGQSSYSTSAKGDEPPNGADSSSGSE